MWGNIKQNMNNSQLECRYCHALGHAKNNCPKLKSKKTVFDTPEPKSMLLARKYTDNSITKIVEKKNTFDTDFPSLNASNKSTQIKPTASGMNFLASVTYKTEEKCCNEETPEEKTIVHNGVVLSVL